MGEDFKRRKRDVLGFGKGKESERRRGRLCFQNDVTGSLFKKERETR